MSTTIISEVSKKNPYWIGKYRALELRYFCRQYDYWKRDLAYLSYEAMGKAQQTDRPWSKPQLDFLDPTADLAIRMVAYQKKIELVEKAARLADDELASYILKAVTEGRSFTNLKTKYQIPCERGMYYDRYRKFFWILDKMKD